MQLVLVLLRIVSFFAVLSCLGQAAPAMNALQDESRLDDGIDLRWMVFVGEANPARGPDLWACSQCAGYFDAGENRRPGL